MVKDITRVTVEWSDGRQYSLHRDHIRKLFNNANPLGSYLTLVFSPEIKGGGWTEVKEQKHCDEIHHGLENRVHG